MDAMLWAAQQKDINRRREELQDLDNRREALIGKSGDVHLPHIQEWLKEIRQSLN